MADQRDWHRRFGLLWYDFLTGQPVTVDTEIDLSRKQQLLDVVLIRKGPEPLTVRMPDGFEELASHNLISFKSFQEALDGWTLNELVGHYVNYRKQVSPNMNDLLPETDFRLFAVTVRFPQNLTSRLTLRRVSDGVYDVDHFTGSLRIVVANQLPQQEPNALLHLFGALKAQVEYGQQTYRIRSDETSKVLLGLFRDYRRGGPNVPIDLQEYAREMVRTYVERMTPEERHDFAQSLTAEERVAGLSPEERLAGLSPEELERLAKLLKDRQSKEGTNGS